MATGQSGRSGFGFRNTRDSTDRLYMARLASHAPTVRASRVGNRLFPHEVAVHHSPGLLRVATALCR